MSSLPPGAPPTNSFLDLDQSVFFDQVLAGFERAASAAGLVERVYRVAGRRLRLRFAGPALVEPLSRAFSHIADPQAAGETLTICAWDSHSSGVQLPLLVGSLVEHITRNRWEMLDKQHIIRGYNGERIRAVFHFGPHILTVMDRQRGLAVYWLADAASLPAYERGYPFSRILNWWLEDSTYQLVHAAAVGVPGAGVLLPGVSGSGKSTTALACLQDGMQLISDDTCLVARHSPDGDQAPAIYSLFATGKLVGEADLQRFPSLSGAVSNTRRSADEKALIYLQERFPHSFPASLPLRAVLLPVVSGQPETRLEPVARHIALMTLFQSTSKILPHINQHSLENIRHFLGAVPSYRLHLGTNISSIPVVIRGLLAQLGGTPPGESQ